MDLILYFMCVVRLHGIVKLLLHAYSEDVLEDSVWTEESTEILCIFKLILHSWYYHALPSTYHCPDRLLFRTESKDFIKHFSVAQP